MLKENNQVSKQIYDYLINKGLVLPKYSFELGLTTNDCLIFSSSNNVPQEYFCNPLICSFQIRLYKPKSSNLEQLNLFDKIIDEITGEEFKKINYNINDKTYTTSHIYVNGNPNPNRNSVLPSLESYTDTTQCYMIELNIYLKENKLNEENK